MEIRTTVDAQAGDVVKLAARVHGFVRMHGFTGASTSVHRPWESPYDPMSVNYHDLMDFVAKKVGMLELATHYLQSASDSLRQHALCGFQPAPEPIDGWVTHDTFNDKLKLQSRGNDWRLKLEFNELWGIEQTEVALMCVIAVDPPEYPSCAFDVLEDEPYGRVTGALVDHDLPYFASCCCAGKRGFVTTRVCDGT